LNLSTIERYIKNIDVINLEDIMASKLPQLKFYFKILSISYLIKDTNVPIISNVVKRAMYIFNDITLTSKPKVIKVLSKSNIVVISINIWDIQSSSKAKRLINRYLNIGSYITTIHGTNINLGIPQCKNYWK